MTRRTPDGGAARPAAALAAAVAGLLVALLWGVARAWSGAGDGLPPPPADLATRPLGTPTIVPDSGGSVAFLQTQAGSTQPVAYDPCRPIHVVVRSRGESAAADALVESALAEVSRVTGLRVLVDGGTDEPPSARRPVADRARYGDRFSPVLVAWSDAQEYPALAGPVIARGGSSSVTTDGPGTTRYVTGEVVLDTPEITSLLAQPYGADRVRGVVLHELGHLVGLDHVEDPGELMYPKAYADRVTFGPGDLRGLAALGSGRCFRDH
jgi:hypothetical protein